MPETTGRKGVMIRVRGLLPRRLGRAVIPREAQSVLVKRGGEVAGAVRKIERKRCVGAGQRNLQQQSDRGDHLTETGVRSPAARLAP
jgi:hypothetical protein